MSLPKIIEQPSRRGVGWLLIHPLTLATLDIHVFLVRARVGVLCCASILGQGYALLDGFEHPLSCFPGSSLFSTIKAFNLKAGSTLT